MNSPSAIRPDAICQRTLNHLTALVRIWTPHEGVVYVNRTWCELTGTSMEDNEGDGWLRFVHDDDRAALGAALAAPRPSQLEYRLQGRDGAAVTVTDCATPWTADESDDLIGLVHTITPRPAAVDDDRTRTMSKWAHELRGPLNAILGWSDLLSAGDSGTDVVQRGLKAIANNARQQALIIKRMTE
jgi:PAS domain S-box-containing protein